MSSSLLHADEETDAGVYAAYLRAQSDTDLLDIALHLDPEKYPARCDSAGRELRRRGLGHGPAYTAAEAIVRRLAVAALGVALGVLTLTGLLTPADAAGPAWPTPEMLPDGLPFGEVARVFFVALLRGGLLWGAHLGVFLWLPAALGGWAARFAVSARTQAARADVWRLALLGFAALTLALCAACGPHSAVPGVFAASDGAHSAFGRSLPLWDPFASAPREAGT